MSTRATFDGVSHARQGIRNSWCWTFEKPLLVMCQYGFVINKLVVTPKSLEERAGECSIREDGPLRHFKGPPDDVIPSMTMSYTNEYWMRESWITMTHILRLKSEDFEIP